MLKYENLKWLWLSLIVILLDQATKLWVLKSLIPYQPAPIFPFFSMHLMFNRGAAFGFLSNSSMAPWLFGGIAIVISALILFWLIRNQGKAYLACGLSLILGGAISNLLDRIMRSCVVDFLDFHISTWHWPPFNLADSAICIGAIMLLLDAFICKKAGKLNADITH